MMLMCWLSSPPYFCTATKTVADLVDAIPNNTDLSQHPLEHLADTPPAPLELPNPTSLGHQPLSVPESTSVLAPA
jgi:hypothetical protein